LGLLNHALSCGSRKILLKLGDSDTEPYADAYFHVGEFSDYDEDDDILPAKEVVDE